MNIVVAVDWRDQSQLALQEIVDLYQPNELTLVHAVHLGALEFPPIASVTDHEAYQEFERAKRLFMDQAEEQLQQLAAHVQQDVPAVKAVNAAGYPESVILQVVASTAADLVVVGSRGLSQFAEFAMGSVSHLVLLHATCATLIVKGSPKKLQRVIVAVKGPDDAERITAWLLAHPFQRPMELVVLKVVPRPPFEFLTSEQRVKSWTQTAAATAQCFVNQIAAAVNGPHYSATGRVVTGDAAEMIARDVGLSDLLVVSTHGRSGVHRMIFGSVSHSLVHRVSGSVLVVR
ncbi:MAG: universal stress protein [Nitrospirales bacterium]